MLPLAAILWQAVLGSPPSVVEPNTFRYVRSIEVPASAGEACAVLDGHIFPHAAPSLRDLRILPMQGGGPVREIPFAITRSEGMSEETEPARVLNLHGGTAHGILFDLEMPPRAYTSVVLDLSPAVHDFVATATVSGSDSPGGAESKALGSFTLFDLASQHLSRDTTLQLEESTFRYLHVAVAIAPAPGRIQAASSLSPAMVRGAEVPPSREAQTMYTTVAETPTITTVGGVSHAAFTIPRRVPVERVSFILAPEYKGSFSRQVRVTAIADAKPAAAEPGLAGDGDLDADTRASLPEVVTGRIHRVHETLAGRVIQSEQLGVTAILGANLQRAAKVDVAIENGGEQPLPIAAVRLEMRQRKVCFDPPAGVTPALYYGDPALLPPSYGYEGFVSSRQASAAELGPERVNPEFQAAPATELTFVQRHPEALWIGLLAAICSLGAMGLRSARRTGR